MNLDNIVICGAIIEEIYLFMEKKIPSLTVGVGNIESTFSLQNYLLHHSNIEKVIFLGSAGVYYNDFLKESFGYSNDFCTIDLNIISKKSKQSFFMKKKIQTNINLNFNLSNFFYGKTNSINSITNYDLNKQEQLYFKKNEILFENMETFGLSFVCHQMKKEFIAFYALTNKVGKNGRMEWKKNYLQMSQKLQKTLLKQF